ncbi:hypothetical protein GO287_04914 [Ralstonia solanacearum]|nr:hypothetical protein [Ralstonia solanacearum]
MVRATASPAALAAFCSSACRLRISPRSGFLSSTVLVFDVSRLSVAMSCFCCAWLVMLMVPSATALRVVLSALPDDISGSIGEKPPGAAFLRGSSDSAFDVSPDFFSDW